MTHPDKNSMGSGSGQGLCQRDGPAPHAVAKLVHIKLFLFIFFLILSFQKEIMMAFSFIGSIN